MKNNEDIILFLAILGIAILAPFVLYLYIKALFFLMEDEDEACNESENEEE